MALYPPPMFPPRPSRSHSDTNSNSIPALPVFRPRTSLNTATTTNGVNTLPPPMRTRSVSQPMWEGTTLARTSDFPSPRFAANGDDHVRGSSTRGFGPHPHSSKKGRERGASNPLKTEGNDVNVEGPTGVRGTRGRAGPGGRGRSSSFITMQEAGGKATEDIVDRLGVGTNENADWVNAPGAWLIHPVLIFLAKVLIDALPGMTQDVSWTIVNLGYMALSFLMFHHVTGVPFEASLSTGGAYDDLTLWEQIDSGAQYTPAKKWLTSVPVALFLISTHYTRYDYSLFALNFAATVFVLFPKLPVLHRLRIHIFESGIIPTPLPSRPTSPVPSDQIGTKLPTSM